MVSARIARVVLRDEKAVVPIGSYNDEYGVTLSIARAPANTSSRWDRITVFSCSTLLRMVDVMVLHESHQFEARPLDAAADEQAGPNLARAPFTWHPRDCGISTSLVSAGNGVLHPRGLPREYSGRFADVVRLEDPSYAVTASYGVRFFGLRLM